MRWVPKTKEVCQRIMETFFGEKYLNIRKNITLPMWEASLASQKDLLAEVSLIPQMEKSPPMSR